MTDELENETTAIRRPYSDPDWFLQFLVGLANTSGLRMGITLQVGGFLVSGELASPQDYFEGLADLLSSATGDSTVNDALRTAFNGFAAAATAANEPDPDTPTDPARFTYINLRGAHVFANPSDQAFPTTLGPGIWWRGRLSDVTGFMLGVLSAEPPNA